MRPDDSIRKMVYKSHRTQRELAMQPGSIAGFAHAFPQCVEGTDGQGRRPPDVTGAQELVYQ